jgi:hypothetical protein
MKQIHISSGSNISIKSYGMSTNQKKSNVSIVEQSQELFEVLRQRYRHNSSFVNIPRLRGALEGFSTTNTPYHQRHHEVDSHENTMKSGNFAQVFAGVSRKQGLKTKACFCGGIWVQCLTTFWGEGIV